MDIETKHIPDFNAQEYVNKDPAVARKIVYRVNVTPTETQKCQVLVIAGTEKLYCCL